MPMRQDCIDKLKALRTCLAEERNFFDEPASALIQQGVFSIPDKMDEVQSKTRKLLMVPACFRDSIIKIDTLLRRKDVEDSAYLLAEIEKIFVEAPTKLEKDIPLSILFAPNVGVLSRTRRTGTHADFGYDKSSRVLYITCLSKKTLEHLDDLCRTLAEDLRPVQELESTTHETSISASPGAGTSPS